jgi:AcrR family transcriptional regulator
MLHNLVAEFDLAKSASVLSRLRDDGIHQSDDRRESIVASAEVIFLRQGLEHASMRAIAEQAGITPVTLYRYFPDKHHLAFEVAARMIRRIVLVSADGTEAFRDGQLTGSIFSDVGIFSQICLNMIDRFELLKSAYQYIGLFDHLYARAYPTEDLATWYRNELLMALGHEPRRYDPLANSAGSASERQQIQVTVLNTIMSFLEKMAARGTLMAGEQGVLLQQQITFFRRFIESVIQSDLSASGSVHEELES